MFQYQYYLDTTLFNGEDDPIQDIDKFEEVAERDYQLRGIVIKYPQRLKFKGDAYDYIKAVRDSDTFCGQIDFKLLIGRENGSFEEYQVGKIYVSTTTFELNYCVCEVEIVDNSYFALIKNNYKCQAFLGSDKSKNGDTITPTTQISIDTYVPSTGATKRNVYGYDLYEALQFMVQFMSDGAITFQSDYFENTTSGISPLEGVGDNRIAILTTKALRASDSSIDYAGVYVTFEQLWGNISRLYDLWFILTKDTNGNVIMKAERYPTQFGEDTQHDLWFSQDLELSFIDTEMYASVSFGSNPSDYSKNTADYLGYIPALTFKPETYNVEGQCNADSSLSLQSDIVTDHNIIAFQIMDATDDDNFDGNLCFLSYNEYNTGVQYRANLYDLLNLGTYPQYYNKFFTNGEIANFHTFHGALRKDNDPGNVLFDVSVSGSAYTTFIYPTPQIIPFNNVASDPGGDFNAGTYKWTCPADGYYIFSGVLNIYVTNLTSQNITTRIDILPNIAPAFNIGAAFAPSVPPFGGYYATNFFTGADYSLPWSFGQFYQTGDIEWLDITVENLSGQFPNNLQWDLDTSTWVMESSVNGGILKPDDRNSIFINKFALKNNIGYDDWKQIRQNLDNPFTLYITPNEQTKVWIKQIKRTVLTGNIEAEFITNNNNY